MSGKKRILGWLAVFAFACAGGSNNAPLEEEEPDTRNRVLNSEYDDRDVGKTDAERVAAEIGILDDPELTAYVDAIGQRLARYAPRGQFDYTFKIVDQDAPNAFALPGGYIFVSRGLLALTNSEDELANVIGHEIVHVARRHASARQGVAQSGLPLTLSWFRYAQIASYSREQEWEADRLGQGLAALAGFDPKGMSTFLRDLEFTERLRLGHSRLPSFLDTHPAATQRAGAAAARASRVDWTRKPGIVPDQPTYLRNLAGIAVGPAAKEGVFRDQRFIHADLAFTLRFPDGWTTQNSHTAVGAISPKRDAQIILEGEGEGDDAEKVGRAFLAKVEARGFRPSHTEVVKLRGKPVFRVDGRTRMGSFFVTVNMIFVPYRGVVYRITGSSLGTVASKYEDLFVNVARSFRPLTRELLATVTETRLQLVEARSGEALGALSKRSGNAWNLQRTAVMNDLPPNATLSAGQLVKVAVSERYTPALANRSPGA